jgi:hypothetical protein
MLAACIKEIGMSKGQHGNKEAKKPKKDHSGDKPLAPSAMPQPAPMVAARAQKK